MKKSTVMKTLGLFALLLKVAAAFETDCDCQESSLTDTLVSQGLTSSSSSSFAATRAQPMCGTRRQSDAAATSAYTIEYRYCEILTVSRVYDNDEDDNCFQNPFCENANDASCFIDNKCNALLRPTNQARCTDTVKATVGGGSIVEWFGIEENYDGVADLSCGLDSNDDQPNCVHKLVSDFKSVDVFLSSDEDLCFSYNATLGEPCDGSCLSNFVNKQSGQPHQLPVANTGRYNAWVEFTVQDGSNNESGSGGSHPTQDNNDDVCECKGPKSFLDILRTAPTQLQDIASHASCGETSFSLAFIAEDEREEGNVQATITYRYCERPTMSRIHRDVDCQRNNDWCINSQEESCKVHQFCHEVIAGDIVCSDFESRAVGEDLELLVLVDDENGASTPRSIDSGSMSPDLSCGAFSDDQGHSQPLCAPVDSEVTQAPHSMNVFATSALEPRLCFTYDLSNPASPCQGRCFDLTATNESIKVAQQGVFDAWIEFSGVIEPEQPAETPDQGRGGRITKTQIVVIVGSVLGVLAIMTVAVVNYNNRRWRLASKAIDNSMV